MATGLVIASFSAGLLVYSGRLLVPAARLRPEDIIAHTNLSGRTCGSELGAGTRPVFPQHEVMPLIRNVMDSKVGLDLLVFGTIGSVFATIADAFTRAWSVPFGWGIAFVAAAVLLGYGAGWAWKARPGWSKKHEQRLLAHCFLAWLEREVGDPKATSQDFDLAVISTARDSGCTLLPQAGRVDTQAADEAVARWIVTLARDYGWRWRRDDLRRWAGKVARQEAH